MMVAHRIAVCSDGRERTVPIERRRYVVVHRSGMGLTAKAIADAFQAPGDPGNDTGHRMPYHVVIGRYGAIEQALRLTDFAPHARRYNESSVSVAVIGDPRVEPLPRLQYQALVAVCGSLCAWLGGAASVKGHDELRDGSSDPKRDCPGKLLDMPRLRDDILRAARLACEDAGLLF